MTNNKDKKVLNVPNLRFPEFTDKWEAGKLEEYILLVSGQDLSSEQYTDKEDVYPYITGASSLNPNRSLGFLCVVRQREIL